MSDRKWSDIRRQHSPEVEAEIKTWVEAEIDKIPVREVLQAYAEVDIELAAAREEIARYKQASDYGRDVHNDLMTTLGIPRCSVHDDFCHPHCATELIRMRDERDALKAQLDEAAEIIEECNCLDLPDRLRDYIGRLLSNYPSPHEEVRAEMLAGKPVKEGK